jgi:leader peptidase (prepilin peptidase)/N-methyltransferase
MEVLQLLEQSTLFLLLTTGAFGLVVGSFLNVVIYRLPVMLEQAWRAECSELAGDEAAGNTDKETLNLLTPASRCPHCNHRIGALENVPVLS